MTSRSTPYEIGYTEEEDSQDEENVFCCPKCKQSFVADVALVGEDIWEGKKPSIELILCEDCIDSFGPSNLYFLWLDWNQENDTIH
mgnify:FL=1